MLCNFELSLTLYLNLVLLEFIRHTSTLLALTLIIVCQLPKKYQVSMSHRPNFMKNTPDIWKNNANHMKNGQELIMTTLSRELLTNAEGKRMEAKCAAITFFNA